MRILVVDDEPPARRRLVTLLGDLGVGEVAGEAGNGAEALQGHQASPRRRLVVDHQDAHAVWLR